MRAPVTIAAIAGWLIAAAAPLLAQPAAPDGWVVLPVDEYRALRDRALGVAPPPPAPPVDATLTRVDYELQLNGDSIAGRALLTIDVLRDGWTRVQIPAGLMVRDARLDGQPVSLVEEGRRRTCCCRAPAVRCSTLDIGRAARRPPPAPSRSRCPPRRRRSTRSRSCCRAAASIFRGGGFVAERAEQPAKAAGRSFGRPNQPLTLSWKRRVDDRRADTAAAHARARHRSWSGSAKTSVSDRVRARRGPAGQRAGRRACRAARARRQSGERRDGRRLGGDRRHAARAAARSGVDGGVVRRAGRHAHRRATAIVPCRSCACRRPSAKPAASPSTSLGAGEIADAPGARARAGRSVRARRHRRRPRVAVDDRLSAAAARRQRSAIACRHRRPLHAAGRAHRQRRRSALSRARRRRTAACSSRRATPSATTSAAS